MVFLITYDLRKPGRDYASLYDAIKDIGDYNQPLESVWLVANNSMDVFKVTTHLKKYMDKSDLIFVVDITESNCQGWLPKSSWEWLTKYR
ncbi:MAG TPA: hypothetical protein GXX42_05145 [Petrimonas sp.]|uniref:hypothetical protein n=1 Tax=Petrimonas sp. TaxID=2023866 RepID=UPI00177656A4|nr:hypothetical protein [Petrimonas sp.]HHV85188.1 hypothetical protein [Petrimonas sp.]